MAGERDLDIAVVGMASRFPSAPDTATYWQNLLDGRDCIRTFFKDELRDDGVPASVLEDPHYVRRSGYLDDVDKFDPDFFGMSQREAELTDPQHRLLLEVATSALDDGGYANAFGGRIGCFAAAGMSLYAGALMNSYFSHNLLPNRGVLGDVIAPAVTVANCNDYLASRIAYKLNLRGPALNVQTACSSGLVAVHLACQALLTGECEMALAGAAAIHAPSKAGYLFVDGGMLSADGICRPFDAAASGTVGGNGGGMVLLKRLADARADGDFVYAVVRGSAINNDGHDKVSFLAPSHSGQVDVVRRALAMADVHPDEIRYVEAHGTGTRLGDPIEVSSLAEAFRSLGGSLARQTLIGSVKGNIGHLDTAAGIASFIKVVLMLQRRAWVRTINFREVNPALNLDETPFKICDGTYVFQDANEEPCAGVSALGAGGTNAHIVLKGVAGAEPRAASSSTNVLTLSARSEVGLRRNAVALSQHIRTSDQRVEDICFSARHGRSHMAHRMVVVANDRDSLARVLQEAASTESASDYARLGQVGALTPKIGFLFSGQGQLRSGIAKPLTGLAAFRRGVEDCSDILASILPTSAELRRVGVGQLLMEPGQDSVLEQARVAQPALFVLQYALSQLWRAVGIEPAQVLGHSVGEFAAGHVAGVFDLRAALTAVVQRGTLMDDLCPKRGAMLAVFCSAERVAAQLAGDERIEIACYNGADNTVVSGDAAAVAELAHRLENEGVGSAALRVTHAFHSALMAPMLNPFGDAMQAIVLHEPRVPFVSTLTGQPGATVHTPEYWVNQVRAPVRFASALDEMKSKMDILLELGPGGMLTALAQPVLTGKAIAVSSLGRDANAALRAAASLYAAGHPVDWRALSLPEGTKVPLPPYSFEKRRCWIAAPDIDPIPANVGPRSAALCLRVHATPAPAVVAAPRGSVQRRVLLLGTGSLSNALAHGLTKAGVQVQLDSAIAAAFGTEWDDVVDVRPLSNTAPSEPVEDVLQAVELAQGLVRRAFKARCWFVAPSPDLDSTRPAIVAGALSGLARTLRVEHPEVSWRTLEVLPSSDEQNAQVLVDELLGSIDDEVLLAAGKRFRLELSEVVTGSADHLQLASDGAYVISGGLGAVGLAIARRLLERGARHLVLLGRAATRPSTATAASLASLRAGGAKVEALSVDVCDRDALARVFERLGAPVKGIVHAAGTLADAVFTKQTSDSFRQVTGPKVLGALNLHELTLSHPLQFFVGISSAAALVGSPGQANYSAANAGLRALMAQRRREGRPATCLHYGPWSIGMAAAHQKRHARLGTLPESAALDALEQAIAQGSDELVVVPHSNAWQISGKVAATALARQIWTVRATDAETVRARLLAEPAALLPDAIGRYLEDTVRQLVGGERVADALAASFHDLGIESLTGLQLKRLLETELQVQLPTTLIYEYPSLGQLRDHLLLQITARRAAPHPISSAPVPASDVSLGDLEALDEQQLLHVLQRELVSSASARSYP